MIQQSNGALLVNNMASSDVGSPTGLVRCFDCVANDAEVTSMESNTAEIRIDAVVR